MKIVEVESEIRKAQIAILRAEAPQVFGDGDMQFAEDRDVEIVEFYTPCKTSPLGCCCIVTPEQGERCCVFCEQPEERK